MGRILDAMIAVRNTLRIDGAWRADGWFNGITGIGTSRDRTMSTEHEIDPWLTPQQCAGLYHHDAIARRIAEARPKHALRGGVVLSGKDASRVHAELRKLGLLAKTREGFVWGQTFGGGAIFLGADDGLDVSQPLPEGAGLVFAEVFDRRDLDFEPGRSDLVRVRSYEERGRQVRTYYVHTSRLIITPGVATGDTERQQLQGWDASIYQCCYDDLRAFRSAYANGNHMISEASVGVFKMSGLISKVAAGKEEEIQARALLADITKSISRSIFLDAGAQEGEDYRREGIQFGGVPEMLDRNANMLAASTGIPVTILMGQAPAGLNATGDADLRSFYDEIAEYRRDQIQPALEKIVALVSASIGAEPPAISWPSLWQLTPKEEAETRKIVADADKIYWDMEAADEEQIARSRWRPEGYSSEMLPAEPPASALPGVPAGVPVEAGKDIPLTPTDWASVTTVNEARASLDMPPLPEPDGSMMIADWKAKNAAAIAAGAAAASGEAGPALPGA